MRKITRITAHTKKAIHAPLERRLHLLDNRSLEKLLSEGYTIYAKNGIIKKVKGVDFGSVQIHFRNGEPYKTTTHIDNLI